jgi:hypothetical protein
VVLALLDVVAARTLGAVVDWRAAERVEAQRLVRHVHHPVCPAPDLALQQASPFPVMQGPPVNRPSASEPPL